MTCSAVGHPAALRFASSCCSTRAGLAAANSARNRKGDTTRTSDENHKSPCARNRDRISSIRVYAGIVCPRGGFRIYLVHVLGRVPARLLEHGGAENPREGARPDTKLRDQQRIGLRTIWAALAVKNDRSLATTSTAAKRSRQWVSETQLPGRGAEKKPANYSGCYLNQEERFAFGHANKRICAAKSIFRGDRHQERESARLVGGGGSQVRTSLQSKFPANREKYRGIYDRPAPHRPAGIRIPPLSENARKREQGI